jgi:putative hydrolase of the HAD superfamily
MAPSKCRLRMALERMGAWPISDANSALSRNRNRFMPPASALFKENRLAKIKTSELKALIVDVDGTLYRQNQVRRSMFRRLLCEYIRQPGKGLLTLRVLIAYRRAQESLRRLPPNWQDLAQEQLRLTCNSTGIGLEVVSASVSRWMEREPLPLLTRSLHKGLLEFLRAAKAYGLRLGVLSDYPPMAKLEAMGLAGFFEVVVSAQDAEVQTFKPNPRGLEVALRRLGVQKHQALYVGDRPDTDAVTASKAGIAWAMIGRRKAVGWRGCIAQYTYEELGDVIFRRHSPVGACRAVMHEGDSPGRLD